MARDTLVVGKLNVSLEGALWRPIPRAAIRPLTSSVRKQVMFLKKQVKLRTPVRKGFADSGKLKKGWKHTAKAYKPRGSKLPTKIIGIVGNSVYYAPFVETGIDPGSPVPRRPVRMLGRTWEKFLPTVKAELNHDVGRWMRETFG